jgi:methionyl-tRNA formyltransferase
MLFRHGEDLIIMKFIIATIKSWNIEMAKKISGCHECVVIDSPDKLRLELVESYGPDYIFFPHWSWIIPEEIYSKFSCVVFHMTDLPFGRGGSPLQNLIIRGIKHTKISAIKVVKGIDAGPVYLKRDLCIEGSAEEILRRASSVIFEMIEYIIGTRSEPTSQEGEITVFKRRTPEQSILPESGSYEEILSFIRMLDGEGYPPACIHYGKFKISFSRAAIKNGTILTDARIELLEE